jgi:uncharacterized membrane protein YphA (DoxX/SURF4 family)
MDATTVASLKGRPVAMPAWKSAVSLIGAVLTALLFLSAGLWKMSDPFGWSRMLEQLLMPYQFSLPSTLLLAVGETTAGVLVLIPRMRRWGALLAGVLLLVFMGYIGMHYSSLIGRDCSCFPWVKRAVGPMFFVEDAGMLLAAILAGLFARPAGSIKTAVLIAAVIALCTGASYGYAVSRQTGTKAPATITVDGQPYSLEHGRIFLFFYDPNCSHCDAAARLMAKLHWASDVRVVGIPTENPQFAASFVHDTGMKMQTSLDLDQLKKIFPFGDPPYGVALVDGREIGPVSHFDEGTGPEPGDTLRKLGFVE